MLFSLSRASLLLSTSTSPFAIARRLAHPAGTHKAPPAGRGGGRSGRRRRRRLGARSCCCLPLARPRNSSTFLREGETRRLTPSQPAWGLCPALRRERETPHRPEPTGLKLLSPRARSGLGEGFVTVSCGCIARPVRAPCARTALTLVALREQQVASLPCIAAGKVSRTPVSM